MQKTKRERFLDVATLRTNRILYDLDLLGKCANKSNYEYTEKEIKQLFSAIDNELRETKSLFNVHKDNKRKFQFLNK